MPKTRLQKNNLVADYSDLLRTAKMVVLLHYIGLSVPQSEEVRAKFFDSGQKLVIVKNSLLRLALRRVGLNIPEEVFGQPLALAVGGDEVQVAKDITTFAKGMEALQIVGGLYDGQTVEKVVVEQLAALPSREELLTKLVMTVHAPIAGFVRVTGAPIVAFINTVSQIKASKTT